MRKLVTGFIAGILVTIAVMLAILRDDENGAAVSGASDTAPTVADSLDADSREVEERRQPPTSASSARGTGTRAPSQGTVRPEDNASEPDECCTLVVGADPGEPADIDGIVAVPYFGSGPELSRPYLTGKWQGVMTAAGPEPDGSPSVVPPFDETRGQYGFRLDIRQTNLVMYFQNGNSWIALGEGQDLRTNERGRSAVVITTLGSVNVGIEVMMLNIMRWDEDSIAVHMSRVSGSGPNGGPLPPSTSSMGILQRATF